jgi:ElaB/YqjD/DUF883 family membrane-anchored ribosome-binding protein
LSEHKETQLRDIEELVRNFRKDVDEKLVDLRARLNVAQKKATNEIGERPMLALGVAFIAGMAVGIALAKSSD